MTNTYIEETIITFYKNEATSAYWNKRTGHKEMVKW